jgi:hypothetical protein
VLQVKKTILLVLCVAVLASAVNLVSGAYSQHTSVWTENSNHVRKFTFGLGETVNINWDNPSGGLVDIKVFYQDLTLVGSWDNQPAKGEVEFQPPSNGFYIIVCKGEWICQFGVGLFFVIPETPFGPIMALGIGFGVFGTFKIVKIRRPRD